MELTFYYRLSRDLEPSAVQNSRLAPSRMNIIIKKKKKKYGWLITSN